MVEHWQGDLYPGLQEIVQDIDHAFGTRVKISPLRATSSGPYSGVRFKPINADAAEVLIIQNPGDYWFITDLQVDRNSSTEVGEVHAAEWARELVFGVALYGMVSVSHPKLHWYNLKKWEVVIPLHANAVNDLLLEIGATVYSQKKPW